MKLNEIKPIHEGIVPITLSMILKRIVHNEGCEDMVDIRTLACLIQKFKNGAKVNIRYLNEFPTEKQVIDEVRDLDGQVAADLAYWFLVQLANEEYEEKYCNKESKLLDWIYLVCRKQD